MPRVTRANGICRELSLDLPFQLGLPRAKQGVQGRGRGVLAGAAVQCGHRHTVTEANKTQSFGPFPVTLLACLLHTVDLAELSGWIKWLELQ